ncbi:TIGR03086 family protein [Pseudonocardiaceae bacterium YIM PH 21723]|nr:TIGR03086 family protein [Pseudonocardiaceae bacterium YIM PH 21723]
MERYLLSSTEFELRLRVVQPAQWTLPTPCPEWNVHRLVNHVTRGNLNYVALIEGGTRAEFLRLRDADALGTDPLAAYTRSVRACAEAFARPGALDRILDYPLGEVTGLQALAIRTTDNVIHTWDLARAIGATDTLDAGLVRWIGDHFDEIYAGLPEEMLRRFFAAPHKGACPAPQDRLLHRMGRRPDLWYPGDQLRPAQEKPCAHSASP